MANTQQAEGTAGQQCECRPAGQGGTARGCRGGWRARGPPTAGACSGRACSGPRFWLLLLTSVLVCSTADQARGSRAWPGRGGQIHRIEFLDRVSAQSDQIDLANLWQAVVDRAQPRDRPVPDPP
jgi:hypothetical protein